MPSQLSRDNDAIAQSSPALAAALSPLGLRVSFPHDIPFQAAEARAKELNGTIGQVTDGRGGPISLPAVRAALDLSEDDLRRGLLYSPVEGIEELRVLWRRWQRRGAESTGRPSSLPIVTAGLTHGLSMAADLFGGDGRAVAVPAPYWANYRQTFAVRTGARLVSAPAYRDGRYNPAAIAEALADEPDGEPAVAILNLPSNPGGYSATRDERERIRASLAAAADRRPLVVLCDDAYAGLVYESEVPAASMFWDLLGVHPDLVPIKIDGATKEFSLFGGRVGFLTFPFEPSSPVAAALESKVKCLVRASIGSPVALAQVVLMQALRRDDAAAEVDAIRRELAARYRALKRELGRADRARLRPQPFNSGCFALVEIPESVGCTSEEVRRHLLDRHDTGIIAIPPRYVRIAFCSVSADRLPEVARRLEAAVAELAGRAV